MGVLLNNKSDSMLSTFDFLNTPAVVVDANLKIVSLNNTANAVFQYTAGDINGRDISELISRTPEFAGELSNPHFESPGRHKPAGVHYESVCMKKNSEIFIAQVSVVPYHADGYKLFVIHDISEKRKLQQRASQRTKELLIFNAFAKILTTHINTDDILLEAIGTLLLAMETDAGWIYLADDDSGELHLKAHKGLAENFAGAVKRLMPGECFSGRVYASKRPLLVRKASEDPRIAHRDANIESIVGVPISSKGVIFGVLCMASRKPSFFSSMDIQLLSTVGGQIGVAVENARLIKQLRDKMEHIELINELSGIINSSLSIGTIFRMMASEIKKLIDYDRASLLLYNEKFDNLLIFALDTELKTLMKKGVTAPIKGTSAGWVARNNKPWINYDLSKAEFPLDRKLFAEGIKSTISIPLFHDRILGVFNLDSTEISKYSDNDLQMLLPIAKHISIALENALLFEEISREKKEWEKTFDAITDMVWIEDGRLRVIRANHTLLTKTGFSAVEAAGKYCWEILEKIGIAAKECLCSDTASNKKPSFRELKGVGGNIFHSWAYPLVDEEGRLYAIVHYLKDVTDQKRLEQQLIRAERLASLGTLVAGIAHEINNPLGIIAGYSEALLDRAKEPELLKSESFEDFPEYLETIHNEIFRCKRILRSLLDFARPSGGTFREIDINELIKEVILLVNNKAVRLNHKLELKLNRDLPKICADPGSLRQLFMNIIINSVYFTPEGGSIVIKTEPGAAGNKERLLPAPINQPQKKSICAAEAGSASKGVIKVSISDTGSGIPGDIIDKIFDPFFTTKPVGEGAGIGLAICHKIVEEHGGTIDVESGTGKGTTFIIKLPSAANNDKNSCG